MELPVHLVCSPGYTPHRAEVWGPHLGTEALVRDNVFHTWKQVKTWYELYLTDILSESNYTVTAKEAMLNSAGDLSSFIPVPPSPAILGPTLPFPGARGPPPLLSWPLCCPDRPPPPFRSPMPSPCPHVPRPPAIRTPAPLNTIADPSGWGQRRTQERALYWGEALHISEQPRVQRHRHCRAMRLMCDVVHPPAQLFRNLGGAQIPTQRNMNEKTRGGWVAQSLKRLSLGFSSGQALRVVRSNPALDSALS